MGFFDDAVTNVKSVAGVVTKKAGSYYDLSKLKMNLSELDRKISKEFTKLGASVYDKYKKDVDIKESIADIIYHIDDLKEQRNTIQLQIDLAGDKKACQSCGEINSDESTFCKKCGSKFE